MSHELPSSRQREYTFTKFCGPLGVPYLQVTTAFGFAQIPIALLDCLISDLQDIRNDLHGIEAQQLPPSRL